MNASSSVSKKNYEFGSSEPKVGLFSPFFLFLIAGTCLSIFLLCLGFVLICKINRRKVRKIEELNKCNTSPGITQKEVKLKRSETEKEFQETKIRNIDKHRGKYSDFIDSTNFEKTLCLRNQDAGNSFDKLYNHSFRTFGQKRRTSLDPINTRYHRQEYQESDSVHM